MNLSMNPLYREFVLPFPPSINGYYAVVRGRNILSKRGRVYKQVVDGHIKMLPAMHPMTGRLAMWVVYYMPDKRTRDLNNYSKALIDAIMQAGVFVDDSQIDNEHYVRAGIEKPGRVEVILYDKDLYNII